MDSELEATANDCAVDIFCWDEHARSAKALKPHDKVSLVNVYAYVMASGVETFTMRGGGGGFGRCIRRLHSPQLVEQLERQLSAFCRLPCPQSRGSYDATFD
ncbi:hypothetical protein AAVH_29367 [Aphelenchoides avenae]|nr:hypothetical protein AAVH_29367 [Aphelenchus avenae]